MLLYTLGQRAVAVAQYRENGCRPIGSSYIAADGTFTARLEARLARPEAECVICYCCLHLLWHTRHTCYFWQCLGGTKVFGFYLENGCMYCHMYIVKMYLFNEAQ
jgi:hypothetical protein